MFDSTVYYAKVTVTASGGSLLARATYYSDEACQDQLPNAYSVTFNVSGRTLNAILNQRSQDMLTANNWNVAQYAVLVHMMARASGLEAGELVHVIADAHIYDRHVPLVEELLRRQGRPAPRLVVDPAVTDFYQFTRDSFRLEGYDPLPFDGKIPVAI